MAVPVLVGAEGEGGGCGHEGDEGGGGGEGEEKSEEDGGCIGSSFFFLCVIFVFLICFGVGFF